MNTGTIFEDKGDRLYHLVAKIGDEGWPEVRRFESFSVAVKALESVMPFNDLIDFLSSDGKLRGLPGTTQDWSAYLGQE
jgi:hypothetical protein